MNLLMCGFEWGTVREATGWSSSLSDSSISTSVVRSGRYSCYLANYDSLTFSLPVAGSTGLKSLYAQFAVNFNSFSGVGGDVLFFRGQQGSLRLGRLTIGDNGQVLIYTGAGTKGAVPDDAIYQLRLASRTRVKPGSWYVFEIYLKIGEVDGEIALRIDGNLEGAFYGNTGNANTGTIYYFTDTLEFSHFNGMWLDDIVVNDDESGWPSCQKIVLLRPIGEGFQQDWQRTHDYWHYSHIDDVYPNPNNYLYAKSAGLTELFVLEDLPAEAETIKSMRSCAWALKNSASPNAQLAFLIQNGSTNSNPISVSEAQDLYFSWQLVSSPWDETNPDTGSEWTVEDVNNLQSGFVSK